jgi:hypothetical protein
MAELRVVSDAEMLRGHLDALNDEGRHATTAGVDVNGNAFLIDLAGPYAEKEVVIFGDPWDAEVGYGHGQRCDECCAADLHQMSDLHFPVTVLIPAWSMPRNPS